MALCKSGQIQNCCHPNALMTLTEYLTDYAGDSTRKLGMELVNKELLTIPSDKVRSLATAHVHDIVHSNSRDFRF